ncbi:MAG TPA: hypothetical protein VNX01_03345, partial [Bacteroidia bacterium]|nr:hypothetical protein [Bacteroidia bacterium]
MQKIVRIHEKILDHLFHLRKNNPELYFVPRKINNKNRFDKGYWFLGDDRIYLNVSFWNGVDWKQRIHNIGFVVLHNCESYIEFSAQDSPNKADFFQKLSTKIGGFQKDGLKDKWHKYYSGIDYIKNLDDFIEQIKPIIDEEILKERPHGISLLDKKFFTKYISKIINLRNKQIELGKINKVSRICWNTNSWKFPSGPNGKSYSKNSHERKNGFGHEEWLFDKSKIIDGYHYAFIQSLFITSDRHYNQNYNITLITINNLNKIYFVGKIQNVKCITHEESERTYQIYKSKGWIDQMKGEIEKAGAISEEFNKIRPNSFFNIKFKLDDVFQPDELIEIDESDINITTNRYKLLPQKTEIAFGMEEEEDQGSKKNTKKRKRVFNSECEYDPYHDQMQNAIFDLLKKSGQYNPDKVYIEKGRVDIKAKTRNGAWHYFELKTDKPKLSIRKALGQILEYAYFPNTQKAEKLIIIADEKP